MSYSHPSLWRLGAVVCRLLLVASLWQGPVLWGHDHSDPARLATHLARFHAADENCHCLGWHWHWSLPEEDDTGHPDGHKPLPIHAVVVMNGFEGSGTISSPALLPAIEWDRICVCHPGLFLDGACPARGAVPARLCAQSLGHMTC